MKSPDSEARGAPVAVFAFRRLGPLQLTLRALERNAGFDGSAVHLFSDGPRAEVPGETKAVAEVRAFLRKWARQHAAELHEAETNRGLRRSIVSGVTGLLQEHDRVIVLEDDIVVSPVFLRCMNEALAACRHRQDIYQVSGYFVPTRRRLRGTGLLRVPACWGWGTWDRAWECYEDDADALLGKLAGAEEIHRFNLDTTYDYYESLRANAEGRADTWMVRWYASIFLRGGLTVYPGRSLTRNIGFGAEGTHCGPGKLSRTFARQPVDVRPPQTDWYALGDEENPEWLAAMREFYRWQAAQWAKPRAGEVWRARWRRLLGKDWRNVSAR